MSADLSRVFYQIAKLNPSFTSQIEGCSEAEVAQLEQLRGRARCRERLGVGGSVAGQR